MKIRKFFVGTQVDLINDKPQSENDDSLKNDLQWVQSQLSGFDKQDWSSHTYRYAIIRYVVEFVQNKVNFKRLITKAWLKFFEILHCYPLLPQPMPPVLKTLHLCEGPGAFVFALSHYLANVLGKDGEKRWSWKANSLNPHYEYHSTGRALLDDSLLLRTSEKNWIFGPDHTGDITNKKTQNVLTNIGKFHLVTGDGGINCEKYPEKQEQLTLPLIEAQITVALNALANGGCFVLKVFTAFDNETFSQLERLFENFRDVHITKPTCSGFGNSERYLVCMGFEPKCREFPVISHEKFLALTRPIVQHQIHSITRNIDIWYDSNYVEQEEMIYAQSPQVTLKKFHKFMYSSQHSNEELKYCLPPSNKATFDEFIQMLSTRVKESHCYNDSTEHECSVTCDLRNPFPSSSPFMNPSVLALFQEVMACATYENERVRKWPCGNGINFKWHPIEHLAELYVPHLLTQKLVYLVFYLACQSEDVSASICCVDMCGCVLTFETFRPTGFDGSLNCDFRTLLHESNVEFIKFVHSVNLLTLQSQLTFQNVISKFM
ncbi:hypothetical protein ACOME3_007042 [Neoechinorhynchus agilis]